MGNSVADFSNPQSWNMYSYVLNNPLKYVDPTGLDCAYLNDAGDGIESSDRNSSIGECNSNGGYWVSGRVNQLQVNDNGSYQFGYTGQDANGNISSVVYQKYLGPDTDNSLSSAYEAAGGLLSDFLTGSGDTVRNYDLSTIEGRNILQSKGIQQLNARIKAGCSAGQQSGPVNLSTGPGRSIIQNFTLSEPNPCTHP